MRPRVRGNFVIVSAPACDPETSKTTSAPAPPVRSLTNCGQIGLQRIHRVDPQIARQLKAERIDLRQHHARAACLRHQRDQNADGAAADHGRELPCLQLAHAHVVAGHRHRFHHGALAQRERIRQTVQRVRRHGPHALQRARRIDPDELQVVADVAVARHAGRAMPAGVERTHGHAVARAPARRLRCPRLAMVPDISCPMTCGSVKRCAMAP